MALGNLLKKAATKNEGSKKGKSTMAVVALPETDDIKEAVKAWREAKADEKTANSLRKQQEEILKPASAEAYENFCRKEGKHHSSVKVQVGSITPMTYVTQEKYSAISLDNGEKLKQIFGDSFERFFKLVTEIKLSEKAMSDIDPILEKIVEAVGGEEKFLDLFDVTQQFKPTQHLHHDRLALRGPSIR